jgi:cytochrome c peroxidase
LLLPFDANANGKAQDDEGADARAGGIGTEALLAFDVPRPERPASGFALDLTSLAKLHEAGPVDTVRLGAGWVRVPPLAGVRASAPYLHNGSVPSLRALLEPASRRPVTFRLGASGFVFDTRLPGNRNIGHEFGTKLSPREKDDLVAFLESL